MESKHQQSIEWIINKKNGSQSAEYYKRASKLLIYLAHLSDSILMANKRLKQFLVA